MGSLAIIDRLNKLMPYEPTNTTDEIVSGLNAIADGCAWKIEDNFIVIENPDGDAEGVALRGENPKLVIALAPAAPSPAGARGCWRPIGTRPHDDSQFLACTADGRVMIFNGVILDHIMAEGERAPRHLQFPATHWMPLPAPPALATAIRQVVEPNHLRATTTCPCCHSPLLVDRPLVDLNTNSVSYGPLRIHLTPREAELLHTVVARSPGTASYDRLIRTIYGSQEPEDAMNVLKVLKCHTCRKIRPLGFDIVAIVGIGLRLEKAICEP